MKGVLDRVQPLCSVDAQLHGRNDEGVGCFIQATPLFPFALGAPAIEYVGPVPASSAYVPLLLELSVGPGDRSSSQPQVRCKLPDCRQAGSRC